MSNYFLTIDDEGPKPVMRMYDPDDDHIDFPINEHGAELFKAYLDEFDVEDFLGSSTLDFPHDYGVSEEQVQLFLGDMVET